MPRFTEQDNTVTDARRPGEAVLDPLNLGAVPLNNLYLLGQRVWLACQVLLLAQINPQNSDPDLGAIFAGIEKSPSLMPCFGLISNVSRSSFDCVLSCSFKSLSQMSVSVVISLSI